MRKVRDSYLSVRTGREQRKGGMGENKRVRRKKVKKVIREGILCEKGGKKIDCQPVLIK